MVKKLNPDDYELDPRKPTTAPTPPAAAPTLPPTKSRRGRKATRVYEPDEVAPIGVGLTFSEGERMSAIARELGVNRHELLIYVLRGFLRDWDAGKRPPTEQKTVLKR